MVSSRNPSAARSPRLVVRAGVICGAMTILLAGCREADEIRTYKAPRIEYPQIPKAQLLAAIIPRGDSSWFFKLQGPPDEVGQHKQTFETFIKSVRFKGNEPSWTLPEGWRLGQGPRERFATINLGPKEAPLELSVTNFGGSVLENVNRWRGQLSQRPVTKDELPKITQELKIDDFTATLVDITGEQAPVGGKRGGK